MKQSTSVLLWFIITLAVLFPLIGTTQDAATTDPVAVEAPVPAAEDPANVEAVAVPEVAPEATPAEEVSDVFKDITNLVQNYKSMGFVAFLSALILLLIKVMKTKLLGSFFTKQHPLVQRAIVVTLGVISGVLIAVTTGIGWVPALVTGLVGSGGAIAVYEVFKPLFAKK